MRGLPPQRCCPIRERNFGSGVAAGSRPPSEPKIQKNKTSGEARKTSVAKKGQMSLPFDIRLFDILRFVIRRLPSPEQGKRLNRKP